jgi:hypothetical protein
MHSIRTRYTVPVAIVLAMLAGPALTGCSVNGLISGVTGGKVSVGSKTLPSDFPSDVPVAKGDVVFGAALGDAGERAWNVTIRVDGASSFDEISKQLQGAGFSTDAGASTSTADGGGGAFANASWAVVVGVAKDGKNGWVANYTVTKATK